jgi:hypothetical protein
VLEHDTPPWHPPTINNLHVPHLRRSKAIPHSSTPVPRIINA